MYELLGICLSLMGLLVVHSTASLLVAVLWRLCSKATESWATASRAQFLFLLRITPPMMAIFCVGGLFVPAYLIHEPRHTGEIVTFEIGLVAALSLYGLLLALWRGCATYHVTRCLIREWLKKANPVNIGNVPVPAYRFRHSFPLIAIVGAVRPKLFIADQVFGELTAEEVLAAVAHENGHLVAGDNLKRWLVCFCRNYLGLPILNGNIDRAWFEATEFAADEHAAGAGASVALDLASALVKIARLAPHNAKPAILAGASLMVQDPGTIRARVLRLTRIAAGFDGRKRPTRAASNLTLGILLVGFLSGLLVVVSASGLLVKIHSVLEFFVTALQ